MKDYVKVDYVRVGQIVNQAMGLDITNSFGHQFVGDFVIGDGDKGLSAMESWTRKHKFTQVRGSQKFTMTSARWRVLTSILDIMGLMEGYLEKQVDSD